MFREQSESEVSTLESEDGRLAWTCSGALSLSRHVGTLCQLLFAITGVQPSFWSQMNLTPWVSSFCSHWTIVQALRSTACSTDSPSQSLWSTSGGGTHWVITITVISKRRRQQKVIHCFRFSIPAYYNSLGYWKLSKCLHVLLLWWSGTVVTVLWSLKSWTREYISKFSPLYKL